MIQIAPYCLPDKKLIEGDDKGFLIWIPDKKYVVLGASNVPEEALFVENVLMDQVAVIKRPSGGQAVVITPNNLIISVAFTGKKIDQPKAIFRYANLLIISALEYEGITGLSMMGISDLAISGKKVLGSAIYRNKDMLIYHAVLNLGEPATTFERYLKHPVKEPDYRLGRKHVDFVSSLKESGYNGNYSKAIQKLSYCLNVYSGQEVYNKVIDLLN